ncbi:MAG: hypothetical protein NTX91_04600 [candidate division SR1 bacterium]|nr:hypothetical protein [candidate division SR1 bacterium]
MEIRSGKTVVEKTEKDIPGLVKLISSKEKDIRNLLIQEKVENPLLFSGKAYDTFHQARKEILATLHILDALGYEGGVGKSWRIFNVGPFLSVNKVDYKSPAMQIQIRKLIKAQEKIIARGNVSLEELRNTYITI